MLLKELGRIVNKTPVPYASKSETFARIFKKQSDSTQTLSAYSSVSTLNAIVSRLANDVSAVDWKLYKKTSDNRRTYSYEGMDSRQEITSHPVLNVLNKPNSFMTRQEFFEVIQQHIDLAGEAFIIIQSEMGVPWNMWPVRPDMMQIAVSDTDFISGYVYKAKDGQDIPFETSEVIHLRMPNPMNPFRGMSPVTPLLVDLDSHRYAGEYNRSFFLNNATPTGIFTVPAGMSDTEFEKMIIRWNEQHRGLGNQHKTAFVEEGKWQSVTPSMADMQFVELRRASSETIMEAFGFPKFKLGIVNDVNRANAEASEAMYAKSLIVPRLERIKQAFNSELLPLFGTTASGVELDYCSPVPDDEETETKILQNKVTIVTMLTNAGFDPTESLIAVGLPPINFSRNQNPGGDQSGTVVPNPEQDGNSG